METKHVQLNGSERDPKYFICCCGVHVSKGAKIIGIIGLIFSTLSIINAALLGQLLALPLTIVSFLLYLLVIIANKTEKPSLYLPYIILNTIGVVLLIGIGVVFVLSGLAISVGGLAVSNKPKNREGFAFISAATTIFGAFFFIWGVISAYFIHVVYRARRYLIEVILNPAVTLAQAGGEV